jgi:hypothetical protein
MTSRFPSLAWAVLALLLALGLAGAATFDRRTWPDFVGDEVTYWMQAASLGHDFDNLYGREDYDRFVAVWGQKPEGVILQSRDGGQTLVYAKPTAYALVIAPFVRWAPQRGAAIANALLLALAALATARALARRIGPVAPLWVAVFLFASVAFAYLPWIHADLFLMSLVALAFSLAYGGRAGAEADNPTLARVRWALVGVLLGTVVLSRVFYAPLLLPAALTVPAARRRQGLLVLGLAAGLLILASVAGNVFWRGSWSSYGGERQSFDSGTGFPAVDFPATDWTSQVAQRGTNAWTAMASQLKLDPRQTAWNGVYFLAGRHVGILPYFLPLLLGFAALDLRAGRRAGRWALPLAALAAAFLFLWVRPFNFYGGGGAIANRYFLPLYPAFWFVAARPVRAVWGWVAAGLAVLLAAPFLLPLWSHPRTFLLAPGGGYTFVSKAAERWLPYETTLSHLKPSGSEDFLHNGLWIKLLSPALRPQGARIQLAAGRSAELLVGTAAPLPGLRLRLLAPTPPGLEVAGAPIAETIHRPDGGDTLRLQPLSPRARHRMWWTEDPFTLYQLRLTAPPSGPVEFQILPEPAP